ncbi:MAG: bifunctional UDP-N-acetylglucosamine diphosphorylase/glucosamine-1-phosphate N-acetyltransferase GlmU [Mariprofundaceae bacterium]|nr:bifunctional UDP-N-acetylglucosamine diphosphorylase/glucosamine-1-phosphate N-acetyltransferase GlmU [Mariprofundaceae bacterium]
MSQSLQYSELAIIVLAAGKGTRMCSSRAKVLMPLLGKSMIEHVLHSVEELTPKEIIVVCGHDAENVQKNIGQPRGLQWVEQRELLGTGHAVLATEESISQVDNVLIVCGDTPMLQSETLATFIDEHLRQEACVSVLSAELDQPDGYGRIVRDVMGEFLAVVEDKDTNIEQRAISEVSSGIFCIQRQWLFELLHQVENNNMQQEYYLPDVVQLALTQNLSVQAIPVADEYEIQGINNRIQLSRVEQHMQQNIIQHWQSKGVSIENPQTVRIEASVRIGQDTTIRAGSQLYGSTHIGDDCCVGPYAVISDSWINDHITIEAFSHLDQASVGNHSSIGPFGRLRAGTELDEATHIGNFVEIKNSIIGQGSKANHLSYIGDTQMGKNCNIGAGSITCNYDGANKHQTNIGDGVFVGSGTKFIAPVRVADGATIGAGSVITESVDEDGLTLSKRSEVQYIRHWKRPTKSEK